MRKMLSYKLAWAFLALPIFAFLSTDVKAECMPCHSSLKCICDTFYPDDDADCDTFAEDSCAIFTATLHKKMTAKRKNKEK